MKRAFDIIFSSIMIIILLPIMILIALLIFITAGRPIFFIQQRVGKDLKIFNMYKFRTMVNSPAPKPAIDPTKKYSGEELIYLRSQFKTTAVNDRRITRIGKLLRKFYLDETLQFFNILKGEMSVVGPRPDTFVQIADYTASQWQRRHQVRPGLTGFSQVFSAKEGYTLFTNISLDIKYAKNPSLCRDLWIIIMTIKRILSGGSF